MREALVIFRKDVRHLWPLGAAVSALVVLHAWVDLRLEHNYLKTLNTPPHEYEPWLFFVAWWCLAGVLMQQERTVGDRQYWLTRPISRKAVVGAKALFLVTFICVPNFLAQAVVLGLTAFPLASYFAALVWNQMLIFCYFAMAAALATVTHNFRLYAVTSVALAAAFVFVDIWAINKEGGQWGGVQWTQEAGSQIAFLAAAVAVVALQYASRRTLLARSILGAGIALTSLLLWTDWWHAAFAITSTVAGHPDAAARQVRFAFNPSAGLPPAPPDVSGGAHGIVDPVRVAIPVRVTGIPQGRELSSERVSVALRGPGGEAWTAGWRVSNLVAAGTNWRNMDEWLTADGTYWLSFNVPEVYFDTVKDQPVRLQATLALSEFTSSEITQLPPKPRQHPVPNVGHCGLDTVHASFTMVSCVMPFENRAAVDFRVQSRNGREAFELSGCCTISYVPFNTSGHFSLWGDVGSIPSGKQLSPVDDVSIEMRRPVSFFEREIVIDDIQLASYVSRWTEHQ